jgi:hypothetical protein
MLTMLWTESITITMFILMVCQSYEKTWLWSLLESVVPAHA